MYFELEYFKLLIFNLICLYYIKNYIKKKTMMLLLKKILLMALQIIVKYFF